VGITLSDGAVVAVDDGVLATAVALGDVERAGDVDWAQAATMTAKAVAMTTRCRNWSRLVCTSSRRQAQV
jgi:hypothetical protein